MQSEDTPGTAAAENGDVTLDGPAGAAITLTPAAARETGRRLIEAADVADGQREAGIARGAAAADPVHGDGGNGEEHDDGEGDE